MRILYRHQLAPNEDLSLDTVLEYCNVARHMAALGKCITQSEYDKRVIERFERDLKDGTILSYEIAK